MTNVDTSTWQPARLIPVTGIKGQEEQEGRATSAFLAVLQAVPEFTYALLSGLGAPRGRIETFTEIRFKDSDGRPCRPDGAILVSRGAKNWSALVEVKTGTAELGTDQVNRYLDIARENGVQAVVTISNQITARPEDVPFSFDRRKARKVQLFHLSWWKILTTAVMQYRNSGIRDPDQAWILGELIAYLDHERSGASGFQDMGRGWVTVREAARQGTLRANDAEAREVVERWEQFLDYLALGLSQDLGRDVQAVRARKQSFAERTDAHLRRLGGQGLLGGTMKVPDAVGALGVEADLKTQRVSTTVEIGAPRDGRQTTRINWLLRQLADASDGLRVTSYFANTPETASVLLREAREQPDRLLSPSNPKREIRRFEIAMTRPLGLKNGRIKGSFIGDTRQHVIDFYSEVVQRLSPWQAKAPKLPVAPAIVPTTPQSDPPPFVSVNDRELGTARFDPESASGHTTLERTRTKEGLQPETRPNDNTSWALES